MSVELRLPLGHFTSPTLGSYSLPSLAEGSEIISEAEEIHEIRILQAKGNKAAKAKSYDEALQYFHEALDIDENNAGVLRDRAAAFIQMGRYADAKADAESMIAINQKNTLGYQILGLCLQHEHLYKKALNMFLMAMDLDLDNTNLEKLTDHIASVSSIICGMSEEFRKSLKEMDAYKKLSEVGVCLFQCKNYEFCIRVLEASQRFETNQKGITMKILLTMANAHTSLKHRAQAISLYLECLQLATATHEQLYQTKSLVNVATLYLEDQDTHQAIVYYEKLLHLKAELLAEMGTSEDLPDFWTKELQCGLHLNLSIAYKSIGNMNAALFHAKRYGTSIEGFGSSGRPVAESHHNTGMLDEILGNYHDALKQYDQYLKISKESGNAKGVAQAYGCMGSVYGALRNWTLSITYHEQYINMAVKSGDTRMIAIANEILADSYMIKKDFDLAIEHYEAMVNICSMNDCRNKSTGLCKLGNAYRAKEKHQHSVFFYERAWDLAKEYGYVDVQTLAEYNLACVHQSSTRMAKIEEAQKYFHKLIPYYETKIQEHLEEDTYCPVEYEDQLLACYDGILAVLAKLGAKDECLEYAEACRMRCVAPLADISATARQRAPPSSVVGWDAWTVDRMRRAVSQQSATVMYYSLLDSALLLWVLQPGKGVVRFYMGKAGGGSTASMRDQIQSLIDDMFSDYNMDNLINECESRALPLPDLELNHIRKRNMKLSKHCTDTKNKTDTDTNEPKKPPQRQLYNILFAPVEDILSKLDPESHLVIIPDKELRHCPFGILKDWNGKYAMDRFHITYLPCLLILEKVLWNELELLRIDDQLEFDRQTARKGGTNKLVAERRRESRCSEAVTTPSDLSVSREKVNLKHVSNPRLYTTGVLLRLPEKCPSPRPGIARESTFNSQAPLSASDKCHVKVDFMKSTTSSARSSPVIGRPMSPERLVGGDTFTTLATRTSTGTDITTSTRVVTLFRQISSKKRCVVYGCPVVQESVELNGRPWRPRYDLSTDDYQSDLHHVAKCLDVDAVVGADATKERLLADLEVATVVHIATYGCWTENKLVMTPNKDSLEEGPATERSYIICPEDIHRLKMRAQLVVLNLGYSPWRREFIPGYSLPASFLAAGAQCVLVSQWQVPDAALSKFYHHFYMALQQTCLLTDAVKAATAALQEDGRFRHVYSWSPFVLIGKDTEVNISEIRHAMLDQAIDNREQELETQTGKQFLNPKDVVAYVPTKEENFISLQQRLVDIIRHHHKQPCVIPGLIDLLDASLKRLHTAENNRETSHLPDAVAKGTGSLDLLKILGFHFQAMGATIHEPYVIYPHWNRDELLIPAFDALRAITDLTVSDSCRQSLCEIFPLSQDHISLLVDLLSITKHASEVQLKVTDLSVQPLWTNAKLKKLLTSAGFHQIGLLLNFNNIPPNRQLLMALLQLLLSVSCHKSPVLLYRLDINLLGSHPSASKQTLYSNMELLRLPSLLPLILPRNQLQMSTPWHSTVEREDEMVEKVKLAHNKSDLDKDYLGYLERAKTWHQKTVTAQANEALAQYGRPKTTPAKVKVISGSSSSRNRVLVNEENTLSIPEVDQRRDYANFVLSQRLDNIEERRDDDVMKLYLPYIHS